MNLLQLILNLSFIHHSKSSFFLSPQKKPTEKKILEQVSHTKNLAKMKNKKLREGNPA